MVFSEKLRFYRKQNNLTQAQVAEILGIDRSAFSYYETGKAQPPLEKMIVLTRLFSCTLDELVCVPPPKPLPNGDAPSYDRVGIAGLPKDEQELLLLYRSLPDSMGADAMKYMKGLSEKLDR